jgi:hypothetical protein
VLVSPPCEGGVRGGVEAARPPAMSRATCIPVSPFAPRKDVLSSSVAFRSAKGLSEIQPRQSDLSAVTAMTVYHRYQHASERNNRIIRNAQAYMFARSYFVVIAPRAFHTECGSHVLPNRQHGGSHEVHSHGVEPPGSARREITDGDCPSWSPDGKKIGFCFRAPGRPPVIRVHVLRNNEEETLGIGWFGANWMADSKSLVANGAIDRRVGMVRLSLDAPDQPTELSTEFERPTSPCCSSDGKLLVFIAKRPKTEGP